HGQSQCDDAKVSNERQGKAAEADEPVQGQAYERAQSIFGFAGVARRPLIRDTSLPITGEAAEAAHEADPLRHSLEGVHDPAVHEAKIAAVERNVQVADRAQRPVKQSIRETFAQPLLPLGPDSVDYLKTIPPR